ncbi:succinylglutamate desuccinylase/aspartoacylase domain-containing protein [Leeia oryzae]|uniref:succinylglutamate desuccinylase/aspartoacylase domain-containing protein n=1 Tax=Leeia oryzae TaxID=356662 RepID=UPI0003663034|nr:succinylglutamate desuccinylase/aspartoacylase family protein [Leeia oryzae]
MAYQKHQQALPALGPGNQSFLVFHAFDGGKVARSAYIHAGIHADEHPGLLVMHHLGHLLNALDKEGRVLGKVTLAPYANPVGMAQKTFGHVTGRFYLESGENFNRHYPCIQQDFAAALAGFRFQKNDITAFKAAFQSLLARHTPLDPVACNKQHLLAEAFRHDLVLDLHCDTSSILHIYSATDQADRARRLARATGVKTVFLEEEAGGKPFDESYAKPWKHLRQAGLVDEALQGFSATLELRGQADVDDAVALDDARGILRFLAAEGLVQLETPHEVMPDEEICIYPLEGVAPVYSPATGIIVYKKQVGDSIRQGELLAEVVVMDAGLDTPRVPLYSGVDGVVVVRHHIKLVRAGQRVALLAGMTPLADRLPGGLLKDF